MHSTDCSARWLAAGDTVRVTSSSGSVLVPVKIDDYIRPGVVSMPHGWGHGESGAQLEVAAGQPGSNFNTLSPGSWSMPSGAINNRAVAQIRQTVSAGLE